MFHRYFMLLLPLLFTEQAHYPIIDIPMGQTCHSPEFLQLPSSQFPSSQCSLLNRVRAAAKISAGGVWVAQTLHLEPEKVSSVE